MHELFVKPPTRFTGAPSYPELPYLRRSFDDLIEEIQTYYRANPKRVDSDNKIANVLNHIPRQWDMDDARYVSYVEDASQGVARAMGFTSSRHKGKIHESGVTLGEQCDEIVLSTIEDFPMDQIGQRWYDLSPYRYLYHTRTDLQMPVLNNQTPGKGYGVSVLNIPMLAVQYRYWLRMQQEMHGEQKESVYRFVGGFVLPNTVESYLDIAFFNRLARISRGIGMPRHPSPHPFYTTDYSRRVDHLCEKILKDNDRRSEDVQQIAHTTPMILKESLAQLMVLPKDPIQRQNQWAYYLASLPYVRYILEEGLKEGRGDQRFINELHEDLIDAREDRVFSTLGSADVVKKYRSEMENLLDLMSERGFAW